MAHTRTEIDSLGSRELAADALYGVTTLRGQENFDISFRKLGDAPEHLKALARIKHAAAAAKLAVYDKTQTLIDALRHLASALEDRSRAFDDVLRIGRTCLQAAQPMRLGQAFGGYASSIRRLVEMLTAAREEMLVLPLGGTAIGTGLGSAWGYRDAVYKHLKRIVGADVRSGDDMFDAIQNADAFARVSSEIRICAEIIGKIASDLIILSSGPNSGIGEIRHPAVQPGSSIMPGKVNPVLPMMMQQVAFAIVGNDAAVSLASLR